MEWSSFIYGVSTGIILMIPVWYFLVVGPLLRMYQAEVDRGRLPDRRTQGRQDG